MDAHALSDIYVTRWRSHVERCEYSLEPLDLVHAQSVPNFEILHSRLDTSKTGVVDLLPELIKLQSLTEVFVRLMGDDTDVSLVWGLVSLIVKDLVELKGVVLDHFAELMREIGNHADVLVECDHQGYSANKLRGIALNMKVDIDDFLRDVINESLPALKKQRRDELYSIKTLEPVDVVYQKFSMRIDATSTNLRQLAQLQNLGLPKIHGDFSRRSTLVEDTVSQDILQFPCIVLPASRNARFFSRQTELETIDSYLRADGRLGLRSLAIHGLGGVGKTQTALAYAYSKIEEYDAVLWVHAETEIALTSSLAEIAHRLKLPQATIGQNSNNAMLVLEWLQITEKRWLAVYDNAEAEEFLDRFWPKSSQGAILVTTRNRNMSRLPCSAGLEIKTFSKAEGSEFLLHLMASQDLGRDVRSPEAEAEALELSARVGGHALALTQMVGLILTRSWSLSEFLTLYKNYPRTIHGLEPEGGIDANYKFLINTVFEQALSGVRKSEAFTLLGILSFLVPDEITQDLFEPKQPVQLPQDLDFCKNVFKFDSVLNPLLRLALVRKESDGMKHRKLSLHRLVQKEYSFFVDPEERQQKFESASILLFYAFPQRVGSRFLHSRWSECEMYIQHVSMMLDCWRADEELPKLKATKELCYLLTNSAWYLHELGTYEVLERFLDTGFKILEQCNIMATEPMLYAKLLMVAGVMWDNWGHFQRSIDSFEQCRKISEENLQRTDEFLAGIYNDLGNTSESMNLPEAAIRWHNKAWEIRAKNVDPTGETVAHSKSNIARSLLMLDKDDEAGSKMDEAGNVFNAASAWFHESHCHFCKGNLHRKHRDFNNAKVEYRIALNLLIEKVKARNHVRTCACYFKLGAIAIAEGEISDAVHHLGKALSICEVRNQNRADRARVLNKLSQALLLAQETQVEGQAKRCEALELYRTLSMGTCLAGDPTEFDYDLLVCGLHR